MEKKKIKGLYNTLTILSVLAGFLIVVDLLLVVLVANEKNTIGLLKTQLKQLEQDYIVLSSSEEVVSQYEEEMEILSKVFPTESSILEFIQELEVIMRRSADEYSIKFNSFAPVAEQDRLFLLLTLTMRTDLKRLDEFMGLFEVSPYMTHITSVVGKMPESLDGSGEVTLGLKVYVNNPFQSK